MQVIKDDVCERRREYFKELIGDDSDRDVSVGAVGLEVSRDRNRLCGGRYYRGESKTNN